MAKYYCDPCIRNFDSKEALEMHTIAKHAVGSKDEIKEQWKEKKNRGKRTKQIAFVGITLIAIALLIYGISSIAKSSGTYSPGQVHWHADLKITVCGENIPLPKPTAGGGTVHGESFIGIPFMHLHDEPQIHIEGTIKKAEDITLGRFMDVIGMNFKDTELLDKKNGDLCPGGKAGIVKLRVNGKESSELTRHVIVDGEEYEIKFE